LEEGIFTGIGANLQLDFARLKKFFNMADASEEQLIERTETFVKNMANATLAIMGSGDLGAGTGLSDKDREFAEAVVGGDISLDEASLKRIMNINERANVFAYRTHNEKVAKMNKRYGANLEYRYYEGQGAINPETGKRIVFNEGRWRDVE
jgi:hypothetical protein